MKSNIMPPTGAKFLAPSLRAQAADACCSLAEELRDPASLLWVLARRPKPRFAPPELASGEVGDERSVVYFAALVLFERLTRVSPYPALFPYRKVSATRARRIHRNDAPTNRLWNYNFFGPIVQPLQHVIDKALMKDPARRWATVEAFAIELERLAQKYAPSMRAPRALPPVTVKLAA